ncbi:hypothetical protein Cni_G16501 [Canna indica]|uniref:DUF4220 domain-containing protein n=1 Tax=Canna indica TaxID=4628 RepID=A0AAQ3QE94_9LILI|nr:hypothetical protein Cni_G16501 [Canna indica]
MVFVAGVIKYGERTLSLWSASMDHLRDSMLQEKELYSWLPQLPRVEIKQKRRSHKISASSILKHLIEAQRPPTSSDGDGQVAGEITERKIIVLAYNYFRTFKRLILDLKLSSQDLHESQTFFQDQHRTAHQAFQVVEVELSFLHDVLHTKAAYVVSFIGLFTREVMLVSVILALVFFHNIEKHGFNEADVTINYVLLGAAILLELANYLIMYSEWAIIRFQDFKLMSLLVAVRKLFLLNGITERWSNSVRQYSLTDDGIKNLIFKELKNNEKNDMRLGYSRGDQVLGKDDYINLDWSVKKEFDESILLWHIATHLCYHTDDSQVNIDAYSTEDELIEKMQKRIREDVVHLQNIWNAMWGNSHDLESAKKDGEQEPDHREISKKLSHYMMYLLVCQPVLLPPGFGKIRFRDTCAQVQEYFASNHFEHEAKKLQQLNKKKVKVEMLEKLA